MAEYRDKDFTGQTVQLDDNTFTGCTFRDCTLVFRGSGPLTLNANHFKENVKWAFAGYAARTIEFMTGIYHGAGEGGRQLIEKTFENIRRGR